MKFLFVASAILLLINIIDFGNGRHHGKGGKHHGKGGKHHGKGGSSSSEMNILEGIQDLEGNGVEGLEPVEPVVTVEPDEPEKPVETVEPVAPEEPVQPEEPTVAKPTVPPSSPYTFQEWLDLGTPFSTPELIQALECGDSPGSEYCARLSLEGYERMDPRQRKAECFMGYFNYASSPLCCRVLKELCSAEGEEVEPVETVEPEEPISIPELIQGLDCGDSYGTSEYCEKYFLEAYRDGLSTASLLIPSLRKAGCVAGYYSNKINPHCCNKLKELCSTEGDEEQPAETVEPTIGVGVPPSHEVTPPSVPL